MKGENHLNRPLDSYVCTVFVYH